MTLKRRLELLEAQCAPGCGEACLKCCRIGRGGARHDPGLCDGEPLFDLAELILGIDHEQETTCAA
jgi:hypothetical protein